MKPGSRAAVAGVRAGDVVADLRYEPGKSSTPVKMTVKRGDAPVRIEFLPAGPSKPRRVFERVATVPNDRC